MSHHWWKGFVSFKCCRAHTIAAALLTFTKFGTRSKTFCPHYLHVNLCLKHQFRSLLIALGRLYVMHCPAKFGTEFNFCSCFLLVNICMQTMSLLIGTGRLCAFCTKYPAFQKWYTVLRKAAYFTSAVLTSSALWFLHSCQSNALFQIKWYSFEAH